MGKILQELKLKKKPPLFCAGKSYQDINYVVWMYIFNITFLMLEHFSFGSLLHRVNLSNSLSRHSLKTFINLSLFLNAWIIKTYACMYVCIQLFRERLSEKSARDTRKVLIWDMINTVSDDCTCRTYFCCFPLALANTFPRPFVPILSNFFKEQWT